LRQRDAGGHVAEHHAHPSADADTKQWLFSPTLPYYYIYNPAYAEVWTEHVWNQAFHDIVNSGAELEQAANKALKRIEKIFAKYPIEQA